MDTAQKKRAAFAKLRDLQGLPLTILFAMLIERKPVTKSFLAMVLQRDAKTVSKSVDFLEFEGYIQRVHYRAWALPSGQLSLPGFEIGLLNTPPPALSSGQGPPGGAIEAEAAPPEKGKNPLSDDGAHSGEARNGKNSGFETGNFPVSGTTTTTVVDTVDQERVVVGAPEKGKIPVSGARKPRQDEAIRAVLKGIRVNGRAIGRNMWPKILACEHVTARYLEAMAAFVNRHPKPRYRTTGFFIHCVLKQDPAPEWCQECGALHGRHERRCSRWVHPYLGEEIERGDRDRDRDREGGGEAGRVWRVALDELALQMTRGTFNTWLRTTRAVSCAEGVFTVQVESERAREWLSNRLLGTVTRTVEGILGGAVTVRFVCDIEGEEAQR